MPNSYAAGPTQPTLGYGQRGEAAIDSVNQWMRTQPWYQALIRSFGQDPSSVKLNDAQKQQVIRAAQANGVVVDEGGNGQEVDDSGNFRAKGHKLRNTLIVAGLAGAALLTAGAAGAFGGAAAAGGSGAAAGTGAGLAGVEGGAYGLGTGAVSALGTGAMGAVPVAGAAGAGAAGAGAALGGGAGVGTTAGVAGGGVAASKGISSWLSPILGTVVPVAGNLIGATIASNANTEAARIQAESAQKALDFEKQQYADLTGRLTPYFTAGGASTDRMAQLLGLPARAGTTATAPPTYGPPVNSYAPPSATSQPAPATNAPASSPAASSGATVLLQAPDGSQKAVPQEQVAYWQSKGAKIVPNASVGGAANRFQEMAG